MVAKKTTKNKTKKPRASGLIVKRAEETMWKQVRIAYIMMIVISVVFAAAVLALVWYKIDVVEQHVRGLEQQVFENKANFDAMIEHYPRFVELTYNTFNGMLTIQQDHEARLGGLENSTTIANG